METVKLNQALSSGTWQYVSLEFAARQVRVGVNKAQFVFELEGEDTGPPAMDIMPLYVAGKPKWDTNIDKLYIHSVQQ